MISNKELKSNRGKIIKLLSDVEREGIDNLVGWIDTTDFYSAPASSLEKYHGSFEGGLAKHSLLVYQELWKKVKNYNLDLPHDSAVLAGICHDFCKIELYIPNYLKDKSLSKAKPYMREDTFPFGHGEKSVFLVQKHIELTDSEALMMRWHMGPFDKEWENYSSKLEKNPEVLLIFHADAEVSKIYKI
ncbi:MAG: hypothetical protein ABIB71_09550 [Candidatus Woesearchaeota archaeon]